MKVRSWVCSLMLASALMVVPQVAYAQVAADEASVLPEAGLVSETEATSDALAETGKLPSGDAKDAIEAGDIETKAPVAAEAAKTADAAATGTEAAHAEAADASEGGASASKIPSQADSIGQSEKPAPAATQEKPVAAETEKLPSPAAAKATPTATTPAQTAGASQGKTEAPASKDKAPTSKAGTSPEKKANTTSAKKADAAPAKQSFGAESEKRLTTSAKKAAGTAAQSGKSDSKDGSKADSAPSAKLSARIYAEGSGLGKLKGIKPGKTNTVGAKSGDSRISAFQMKLDSDYEGSVEYQAYVFGQGWTTVKADGQAAGFSSSSKWLEGVRMSLTGDASRHYDLQYRVCMTTGKWGAWTTGGGFTGVTNDKGFITRIRIRLVEKDKVSKLPATGIVGITYGVSLSGAGAQDRRADGAIAGGTSGIDALEFSVGTGSVGGGVQYRAYIDGREWTDWSSDGIGTSGQRHAISAVQVMLTGDIAKQYDAVYRTGLKGSSWQPWVANGGISGKAGSTPISAIQVVLRKKGTSYDLSEGSYIITRAENAGHELAASGTGVKRAAFNTNYAAGKFYVHKEKGGVSLQSVSTGKFITAGAQPVLKAWSGASDQVWKVTWDGGLRFTNAKTGAVLGLTSKGFLNATGSGLMFRGARLLNDGTYTIKNAARLTALDLAGGSWSSGANFQVFNPNGTGNQAFDLAYTKNGFYTIVNTMTGGAVSVNGASKVSGANVLQRGSNRAAKAQQWRAYMTHRGSVYFINYASGKALTARSGGKSGGNVESFTYKNVETQQWWLEATSWRFTGNRDLDRYLFGIAADNDYNLRDCFDWMWSLSHVQSVDSRIHWGIMDDDVSLSYVEIARDRGVADCYTDAGMFCWLARACGYEANMRAGGCPSASGGTVPHGWTEVYVNGTTYVCDANLRRDLPSYNWYMVTYASAPVAYSL